MATAATNAVADLVDRLAEQARAGDRVAAARTRVVIASTLRNADRWADAAEAAEEALRHLEGADPSGELGDNLAQCRYLLWQLYRKAPHHYSDALQHIDELLATGPVSREVPPRAALLEECAFLLPLRDGVDRLLKAVALHRSAEQPGEEQRVLALVLRRSSQLPADDTILGAVARWRELASAGEVEAVDLARADLVEAQLLANAGRFQEALDAVAPVIETFASQPKSSDLPNALLLQSSAYLQTDRPGEAERIARQLLGLDNRRYFWPAADAVVRALRQQGKQDDVGAFLAEHDLDPDHFIDEPTEDD